MGAIESWNRQVETHHAQSIKAQENIDRSGDFWRQFASRFRADPRRTDDDQVNRLLQEINPDNTVLDVGGGAGRLALPLSLKCRHVTVVEPSESMVSELRDVAQESGIENVSVVETEWEQADTKNADVVLCSHVVYGVQDIEPFLAKLHSHATERVIILTFFDSPQAHLAPFWGRVHQETRINLPALPGLVNVLWEMDIHPNLDMFPTLGLPSFNDKDSAVDELRRRLYVQPDTEQDQRLHASLEDLLQESGDSLAAIDARPRRLAMVSWKPGEQS